MIAVDPTTSENQALLEWHIHSFHKVIVTAENLEWTIPLSVRRHFRANILAQSRIIYFLVVGFRPPPRDQEVSVREPDNVSRQRGEKAITAAQGAKSFAEDGEFRLWYTGDRRMDVPSVIAATRSLRKIQR